MMLQSGADLSWQGWNASHFYPPYLHYCIKEDEKSSVYIYVAVAEGWAVGILLKAW